jgi:hypothetical protein
MTGGVIEVHGRLEDDPKTLEFYRSRGLEAGAIGKVLGGRIMHRGECIVDKEEIDKGNVQQAIERAFEAEGPDGSG